MSTKATSRALAAMRYCIKSGEPWTVEMEAAFDAATAELEAIRKAATVAHACGIMYPVPNAQTTASEWDEAVATMDSIAKEGP